MSEIIKRETKARHILLTYQKIGSITAEDICMHINRQCEYNAPFKNNKMLEIRAAIERNKDKTKHAHVLITLEKKTTIRLTPHWINSLKILFNGNILVPHIEIPEDRYAYAKYIEKYKDINERKLYFYLNLNSKINGTLQESIINPSEESDELEKKLRILLSRVDTASLSELRKLSADYSFEAQMSTINKQLRTLIRSMIKPDAKEVIHKFRFDNKKQKYEYNAVNPAMVEMLALLLEYLRNNSKQSLFLFGESNIGKSSLVRACLKEACRILRSELEIQYSAYCIREIENALGIDKLEGNVALVLDDIDIKEEYGRDLRLNLMEGNEFETSIKVRYEDLTFGLNIKKIFIHNKPISKKVISKEEEARYIELFIKSIAKLCKLDGNYECIVTPRSEYPYKQEFIVIKKT